MSNLVRFHDWLFDREQILVVEIKSSDGQNYDQNQFAKIKHSVIVKLKNDTRIELLCADLYDARRELNYLTANTNAELTGPIYRTYLITQISYCWKAINGLTEEVKKLMKSYKKIKTRE